MDIQETKRPADQDQASNSKTILLRKIFGGIQQFFIISWRRYSYIQQLTKGGFFFLIKNETCMTVENTCIILTTICEHNQQTHR